MKYPWSGLLTQVKRTIRRRRRRPHKIVVRMEYSVDQSRQYNLFYLRQSSSNNFLQLTSHQEQFNSKPINVEPIFYRYCTCGASLPHPPRNNWYRVSSRGKGKCKVYSKECDFCIEGFFLQWIPQQVCRQHTKRLTVLVPQSLWELGMLQSIRIL